MAKKRVTGSLTIRVSLVPGRCRWCNCTYERPCEGGCGWANREQTLCTACVDFDRLVKTARGRAELVGVLTEWQDAQNTNTPARNTARRRA